MKTSLYLFISHNPNCEAIPIVVQAKNYGNALTKLKTEMEKELLKLSKWEKRPEGGYMYYYPNPHFWMELEKVPLKKRSSNDYFLVTMFDWKRCEIISQVINAKNFTDALSKVSGIVGDEYSVPNKLTDLTKEGDDYYYFHETKKKDYYVSLQKVIFPKGKIHFYHK